MSSFVEHLPHAACGSRDNLAVFEEDGKYSGWCFGCGKYEHDPYHDKPADYKPTPIKKSDEEIAQELYDIWKLPVMDIASRGINASTLLHYGMRVGVSEADGETPAILYSPYTRDSEVVSYKAKLLEPKKLWAVGSQRDVDPCGWDLALASGNPKLIITEGEPDMAAMYQMIKKANKGGQWEDLVPAVISLPHGAGGAVKDLTRIAHQAENTFREIILAFDMDEAGQDAAKAVIEQVFPNAKIAHLPLKDANACLLGGRSKSCVKAVLWNSLTPKNTSIKTVHDLAEEAKTPPAYGWSYPWEGLTEATRGIRTGEVITLAAAVKLGKSSVVKQIAAHLMIEEDVNVLVVSPEESPARTLQGMAGIVAKKVFTDPNIDFDEGSFDKAIARVENNLFILASYQLLNWDSLKADIKYAIVADGCKAIFLDPISNLIAGMSSSEANEFLNNFMPEIAKMALDYEVVFILTSHLKATDSGEGHEEGAKVLLKQLTGSRAIIRSSNLILGLEGDLSNEDENLRRFRNIRIMADRFLGAIGNIKLWWNDKTYTLEEVKE